MLFLPILLALPANLPGIIPGDGNEVSPEQGIEPEIQGSTDNTEEDEEPAEKDEEPADEKDEEPEDEEPIDEIEGLVSNEKDGDSSSSHQSPQKQSSSQSKASPTPQLASAIIPPSQASQGPQGVLDEAPLRSTGLVGDGQEVSQPQTTHDEREAQPAIPATQQSQAQVNPLASMATKPLDPETFKKLMSIGRPACKYAYLSGHLLVDCPELSPQEQAEIAAFKQKAQQQQLQGSQPSVQQAQSAPAQLTMQNGREESPSQSPQGSSNQQEAVIRQPTAPPKPKVTVQKSQQQVPTNPPIKAPSKAPTSGTASNTTASGTTAARSNQVQDKPLTEGPDDKLFDSISRSVAGAPGQTTQ